MKIDFNAQYRNISRIVEARPEVSQLGSEAKASFGKLLGGFSLDKKLAVEITEEKAINAGPRQLGLREQHNEMASINLAGPSLLAPELEPQVEIDLTAVASDHEPAGVKTPTILEARRINRLVATEGQAAAAPAAELKNIIADAGREHGVDPALSLAVVSAESSFNVRAVSADGHASKGLFQLLDKTAQTIIDKDGLDIEYDPFDAAQNVQIGTKYLRYLHDLFNTDTELPNQHATKAAANSSSLEKLAVAAFNAGEGRVASAQERAARLGSNPADYDQVVPYLPESTQEYVRRVLRNKESFSGPEDL